MKQLKRKKIRGNYLRIRIRSCWTGMQIGKTAARTATSTGCQASPLGHYYFRGYQYKALFELYSG